MILPIVSATTEPVVGAKSSPTMNAKITSSSTFESFEQGISGAQNDGWVFANPSRWSTSTTPQAIDGNYVLMQTAYNYPAYLIDDSVQYQKISFENGSIDGWVYAQHPQKISAIYLRTSLQTTGGSCTPPSSSSICNGYQLRLYDNRAELKRFDNGNRTILGSYNLGQNYNGQWWYIKLEAVGTEIAVWVSNTDSFTNIAQISVQDSVYTTGYAAISGRTNFTESYYQYFDAVTVNWNQTTSIGQNTQPNAITMSSNSNLINILTSSTLGIIIGTLALILALAFAIIVYQQKLQVSGRSKLRATKKKERHQPLQSNEKLPQFCINCHSSLSPSDNYCQNCGTPIINVFK